MARKSTPPTITQTNDVVSDYKVEHESFGSIGIFHTTGAAKLFGSFIRNDHYITIQISRASLSRNLGGERHYPGEQLIEVCLSPLQWAELISTPNTSGGVPCTISSIGNRLIPECSEVRDPRAEIVSDYAKSSSDAAKCLSDAIAIAEELAAPGAKVPKSQIIKLKEAIAAAQRELAGTAPFYLKQFTESCDKITTEAKATIEASYLHVVNVLGNQKIAELTGGGLPAAPQAPAIEGPRGEPVYDVPRLLCSKCWNPEVSPLPDKSSVQCAGCGEIRGIPTGAVVVKFRRRGKDGAKFYFHLRDEIDGHECDDGGVSELDLIGGEN